MRHLLAIFAALGLLFAVPASAQFLVQETLIDVTDATTDSVSEQRAQHPSAPNTIWYSKLNLTDIDGGGANGITMSIQYYDKIDTEWDGWMTGCTEILAAGECVMVFTSSSATDHATLVSTADDDIDVVHVIPLPAIWRVIVEETTNESTATYTVTHWRH